MSIFRAGGFLVRPAAATSLLLALGLVTAGCGNPRAPNTPPLDAYALSGGKITDFMANPYMPADPSMRALLESCQKFPLKSKSARSACVLLKSRKGTQPIPALTVDNVTLILVGSVERMLGGEANHCSRGILNLPDGHKRVKIGGEWIMLNYPVIAVDNGKQMAMALPDLLALFHACDVQRGGGHEIQLVTIVYGGDPNQLYK